MTIWLAFRLPINPDHLLTGGVCHPGQDASLGYRGIVSILQHSTHWNVLVTKCFDEESACLIVSHSTDWKDIHPEICEIANCVGTSTGNHRAIPVFQDKNRRLTRHA